MYTNIIVTNLALWLQDSNKLNLHHVITCTVLKVWVQGRTVMDDVQTPDIYFQGWTVSTQCTFCASVAWMASIRCPGGKSDVRSTPQIYKS